MPAINPFERLSKGFTLVDMTAAIDMLPPRPSRIMSMRLFRDISLTSPTAMIEVRKHTLVIIPTTDWRSPPPTGAPGERKIQPIMIPHTAWSDAVMAVDVMGVRRFGSENVLETVGERVLDKLQTARDSFDATEEFRELSALKGIVTDSDGATKLFDSFQFFGLTRKTFDFKFSDPGEDVRKKIRDVKRYVDDNLFGETVSGLRAFVGRNFFDKLVAHPSIKEALLGWQGAEVLLRDSRASGFKIEDVSFEEYNGKVSATDGKSVFPFMEPNEGTVVPLGTTNTFVRYIAPAARIDTVNTLGRPYYAWQDLRQDKMGIDIHVESNTMPICLRPGLLVKLTMS
jgi:hypothetical protein